MSVVASYAEARPHRVFTGAARGRQAKREKFHARDISREASKEHDAFGDQR